MRNYDDLYGDRREWIEEEDIDYMRREIYWSMGFQGGGYDVVRKWW
ncbi:family 10 glycosylhydrolase [Bacillus altitudinis]|nr:family 10 glycosylhydrolase [Bacillus altitudinis]